MSIIQLDTENADRDIKTALITVLTHTPSASLHMTCQGYVKLGDGAKNLDGTGGTFNLVITVGGQTVQPSPQEIVFGTEARSSYWSTVFPVPANEEVIMRILSPNVADTDVDVTAYLFDVSAQGSLNITLNTAQGEPGQANPAVNETPLQKIAFLFKAWRNKKDNDGTTRNLYNDAGAVVDQKSGVAEAGGTVTTDEWESGP